MNEILEKAWKIDLDKIEEGYLWMMILLFTPTIEIRLKLKC